jgi:hypothetical protein
MAAGASGALLGAELWLPALVHADASGGMPKPLASGGIPGTDFRIFGIGPGIGPNVEMSTITDFNGFVGAADIRGMATDQSTGERLLFDTDMRFMDGVYLGTDGRTHQGTFGFV